MRVPSRGHALQSLAHAFPARKLKDVATRGPGSLISDLIEQRSIRSRMCITQLQQMRDGKYRSCA